MIREIFFLSFSLNHEFKKHLVKATACRIYLAAKLRASESSLLCS